MFSTNPAGYAKDGFRVVHLQGGVRRTSGSSRVIGTLPQGYRPAHLVYTVSWGYNAITPAYIEIESTGDISVTDETTGGSPDTTNVAHFTSLEGVTFAAAGPLAP